MLRRILYAPDAAAGGSTVPDQADMFKQVETLTASLTEAQTKIVSLEPLAAEVPDLKSKIIVLETAAASSVTAMAAVTTERDLLKTKCADFEVKQAGNDKWLAGELAKRGIKTEAIATPVVSAEAKASAEAYMAITDPVEKAKYFQKHEKELRALAFGR